jgi:AraC-like DNA-binding protein
MASVANIPEIGGYFGDDKRCIGVLSRLAYRWLKEEGIDPDPLLSGAGLSERDIAVSSFRIRITSQIKFLQSAAAKLGDPLFGFHLCEELDFRKIGWLYYVASSASTFGTALRRLERYSQIGNEGVRLNVTNGDEVTVCVHYIGLSRRFEFQQISSFIGSIVLLSRHLTGGSAEPTLVRLAHNVGSRKDELERILRCKVDDCSGSDEIVFSANAWRLETVCYDPYLHELCVNACEHALSNVRNRQRGLKSNVENLIAESLPHGEIGQAVIAGKMAMSPRTFTRRLAAEGCSFSDLVKEVRLLLGRQYLSDGMSVSETAWLLGYAEVSTFTRAFHRWTGALPSAALPKPRKRGADA